MLAAITLNKIRKKRGFHRINSFWNDATFSAANGQAGSLPAESGWKPNLQPNPLLRAKKLGFSDRQLAIANGVRRKGR